MLTLASGLFGILNLKFRPLGGAGPSFLHALVIDLGLEIDIALLAHTQDVPLNEWANIKQFA